MSRIWFFLFLFGGLFLGISSTVQGQGSQADSIRVLQLARQSLSLAYSNSDSAWAITEELEALACKTGNPAHLSRAYNIFGVISDIRGQADSAVAYYRKGLRYAGQGENERENLILNAQLENNLGLIYWNQADYPRATDYYLRSLAKFRRVEGAELGVVNTLSNLAVIYQERGNRIKAQEYLLLALRQRQAMADTAGIGISYTNLALFHLDEGIMDSVAWYARRALRIKKDLADEFGIGINNLHLGSYYLAQSFYDSAYSAFSAAEQRFVALNNPKRLAVALNGLTAVALARNEADRAIALSERALEHAREAEALDVEAEALFLQGRALSKQGGAESAYALFLEARDLEREIFSLKSEETINEMTVRYETAEKEKALAMNRAALAQERLRSEQRGFWLWLLGIAILLVATLSFFLYRQQRLKQSRLREQARLKQKLAQLELKKGLEQQRVRISRDLHDHIGAQLTIISSKADQLAFQNRNSNIGPHLTEIADQGRETIGQLRETIWAMQNEKVSLPMLTAKLQEYCQRFQDAGREIRVELDEACRHLELGPAKTINLFRVAQEAVHNAVKHADFSRLKIALEADAGLLRMQIHDNGKGFEVEEAQNQGMGLASMQQRMKEVKGRLALQSEPGKGTTLCLEIRMHDETEEQLVRELDS